MEEKTFSHEDLLSVIKFLAKEKNISPETLISESMEKIDKEKIELSNILDKLSQLNKYEQEKLKIHINDIIKKNNNKNKYSLYPETIDNLSNLDTNDLVKTTPKELYINDEKILVKNWAEVTDIFVKKLIDDGYITKDILPFFNNEKSSKAYINNINKHQNGKNGIFHKIYDGFYVDIKYNAKYHVLNIIRTLNKLSIKDKYDIKIQF